MKTTVEIKRKVCMLGSFGVGKTSLVRRFVYGKFEEKYQSTIGVLINQKHLPPYKNTSSMREEQLNLIIWDLANIEKFTGAFRNYFRGSHGAIVVLDSTRLQTLKETDNFLKPFLEMNPQSKLIFAVNKIDFVEKNALEMEQFLQIAQTYKSSVIFTSAKTGENVEELFTQLGALLLEAE